MHNQPPLARPAASFRLDDSVPTDFSFPFGYAFNTLVVYGCLIYLVWMLPFPRCQALANAAGRTSGKGSWGATPSAAVVVQPSLPTEPPALAMMGRVALYCLC